MTVTVSPPIRIFAGLGVIAAVGLALFFFVLGRTATDDGTTALPVTSHAQPKNKAERTPTTHKPPAKASTPRLRLPASGFPSAVDRAFRKHRVVVLAVFMPGSGVDAVVRREARAAAIATRAGYVRVNALNEGAASKLLAKMGVLPDPAVVVLRRPGIVTATLGVTDRATVVQAVAEARR
jgi:hypothetical protein